MISFCLSLAGYFLNGTTRFKLHSYVVWFVANSSWGVINYLSGNYIMSAMFVCYNVFCVYNFIKNKNVEKK